MDKTVKVLLFPIIFFLFFSYIHPALQIVFAASVLLCIIVFFLLESKKQLVVTTDIICWSLVVVASLFSIFKSPSIFEAIKFISILASLVLLKLLLVNLDNWRKPAIIYFFSFSFIHVWATVAQRLRPDFIDKVNSIILPSELLSINRYQLSNGGFAGITGQTGTNAFFISMSIAIVTVLFFTMRKKVLTGSLLCLGYYSLLLTDKRALLLFNISVFIVVLIYNWLSSVSRNKRRERYLLLFMFIIIAVLVFSYFSNNSTGLLEGASLNDFSSGRIEIYSNVYRMIAESPLFGNGLNSVEKVVGIKAHNIYLQILAEGGIVMLILYLSAFLTSILQPIAYIKQHRNRISQTRLLFLLISIYSQAVFILYGLTGNPLYDYFILGTYFIMSSMTFVNKKENYQ